MRGIDEDAVEGLLDGLSWAPLHGWSSSLKGTRPIGQLWSNLRVTTCNLF